ncbi:MAG: T9SS type A sorting domain-containing protein, partial [Bacteroidales bacterium]|nr:T9SS type A sorting domain-containing protein [Bacteroidales bacterium]
IDDISGDGINDVLIGTLYSNNYCYFLNGVDGSELHSINFGEPIDAIAAIPDIAGDGSMEMVAGGRNGKVYCYSGGLSINPEIFVPVDNYNFGTVTIGDSAVWNMKIQNTGGANLIINNLIIQNAAPVFYWMTFPQTILPSDSLEIPLIYKPTETGILNTTAVIQSNDPVTPEVNIYLTGDCLTQINENNNNSFIRLYNHPNPFSCETNIMFTLINDNYITLNIFDFTGHKVITLKEGFINKGTYKIRWNGKNINGDEVNNGIYFCKLNYREGSIIRKIIIIK